MVFEKILDDFSTGGWQVTSVGNDVGVLLAGADGIDVDALRERFCEELKSAECHRPG